MWGGWASPPCLVLLEQTSLPCTTKPSFVFAVGHWPETTPTSESLNYSLAVWVLESISPHTLSLSGNFSGPSGAEP